MSTTLLYVALAVMAFAMILLALAVSNFRAANKALQDVYEELDARSKGTIRIKNTQIAELQHTVDKLSAALCDFRNSITILRTSKSGTRQQQVMRLQSELKRYIREDNDGVYLKVLE